jgi:hypothetical protein
MVEGTLTMREKEKMMIENGYRIKMNLNFDLVKIKFFKIGRQKIALMFD